MRGIIINLNKKLWLCFLLVMLMSGCKKKEDIFNQTQPDVYEYNNSETHKDIGHDEQTDEDIIYDVPTEEAKVGIRLKSDMPDYDGVVYVNRGVTELKFYKLQITDIEGLEQLEFLETVVFGFVRILSDFTFLSKIPHLKKLFIDYNKQIVDWSFIGQLPNLEVLHINYYSQPTISIDLKNNECLEYIGFTSGDIETFPALLNIPNSLKYINLEINKITSLPTDLEIPSHTTIFMGMNPFKEDATTPANVTVEFSEKTMEQKYNEPLDIQYIRMGWID